MWESQNNRYFSYYIFWRIRFHVVDIGSVNIWNPLLTVGLHEIKIYKVKEFLCKNTTANVFSSSKRQILLRIIEEHYQFVILPSMYVSLLSNLKNHSNCWSDPRQLSPRPYPHITYTLIAETLRIHSYERRHSIQAESEWDSRASETATDWVYKTDASSDSDDCREGTKRRLRRSQVIRWLTPMSKHKGIRSTELIA